MRFKLNNEIVERSYTSGEYTYYASDNEDRPPDGKKTSELDFSPNVDTRMKIIGEVCIDRGLKQTVLGWLDSNWELHIICFPADNLDYIDELLKETRTYNHIAFDRLKLKPEYQNIADKLGCYYYNKWEDISEVLTPKHLKYIKTVKLRLSWDDISWRI